MISQALKYIPYHLVNFYCQPNRNILNSTFLIISCYNARRYVNKFNKTCSGNFSPPNFSYPSLWILDVKRDVDR